MAAHPRGEARSLRLAADLATDKRKGYAFIEYPDDETARSACHNLDSRNLRGRELRVGLPGRQRHPSASQSALRTPSMPHHSSPGLPCSTPSRRTWRRGRRVS